jgi:hypothetical protein
MLVVVHLLACDLGRITVNTTAEVLVRAQPAIQQESDYQLARDAIPATLKTIEGFWVVSPENQDLLTLLTEGYCQYGTGFVEDDWEVAKFAKKPDEVAEHNARATRIFTRCLNYALIQLGGRWQNDLFDKPDVINALIKGAGGDQRDAMMWAALALGSIVNHNLSQPALLPYISTVESILLRVLDLDKTHPPGRQDYAALPHVALGLLKTAVSKDFGGRPKEAEAHFKEALRLTNNKMLLARTLMGYRLGVITNDQKFFHAQLKEVLETDPANWPEQRLANEVAQRRARRYLSHEKELFQ